MSEVASRHRRQRSDLGCELEVRGGWTLTASSLAIYKEQCLFLYASYIKRVENMKTNHLISGDKVRYLIVRWKKMEERLGVAGLKLESVEMVALVAV